MFYTEDSNIGELAKGTVPTVPGGNSSSMLVKITSEEQSSQFVSKRECFCLCVVSLRTTCTSSR